MLYRFFGFVCPDYPPVGIPKMFWFVNSILFYFDRNIALLNFDWSIILDVKLSVFDRISNNECFSGLEIFLNVTVN
jgi:hypothetical protein